MGKNPIPRRVLPDINKTVTFVGVVRVLSFGGSEPLFEQEKPITNRFITY